MSKYLLDSDNSEIRYLVEILEDTTPNRVNIEIIGFLRNKKPIVPPKTKYSLLRPKTKIEVYKHKLKELCYEDINIIYTTIDEFISHNAYLWFKNDRIDYQIQWDDLRKLFAPSINPSDNSPKVM